MRHAHSASRKINAPAQKQAKRPQRPASRRSRGARNGQASSSNLPLLTRKEAWPTRTCSYWPAESPATLRVTSPCDLGRQAPEQGAGGGCGRDHLLFFWAAEWGELQSSGWGAASTHPGTKNTLMPTVMRTFRAARALMLLLAAVMVPVSALLCSTMSSLTPPHYRAPFCCFACCAEQLIAKIQPGSVG
jgi:hypothetical protein